MTVPPGATIILSAMNTTNTLTEYKDADTAWEAGNEWVQDSTRFEKLDFLMETASPEFKDRIVNEMARWMGQEDFNKFFNHLRRSWDIKTPQELDFENKA